jgi:large subunit ribosomal protein L10
MVTKQKKQEIVLDLVDKFKRASGFYLVDFMGMKVSDSIRLRREFKKIGIEFRVAKNTLVQKALAEVADYKIPDKVFTGATAVIFGYDDAVIAAKVIKESFDKRKMPILKAAVLDGVFYDGSKLNTLASLPTKKDIYAGIVGSLQSPISGIVGSINAVMRDLASLVEEVAKSKAS